MKPLTLAEYKAKGTRLEAGMSVACKCGCSATFNYDRKSPRTEFYGKPCRAAYHAAEKRIIQPERECIICHKMFTPEHPRYVACPGRCREERTALKRRGPPKEPIPPKSPDEIIRERELAAYERQVREGTGKTAILADLLTDAVRRVNESDLRPHPVKRRSKRDKETMVVLRSDWHPGIITPSYNLAVFHKRVEMLTEKVILFRDIISETIPIERLVVIDLGDMVSGQDIYPDQAWKSEKHVLEQVYHEAAPAIIRQNMAFLEYFPEMEEHSIPGNHGRAGKYVPLEVNFDNILAQDIYRRFDNIKRFSMDIEWDWWKYVDIYGWRLLALHGNQMRSWLGIPFYGITQKGMRWQGSMPRGPWHCLIHGHFHTPFTMPWNNFRIISNGSLVSDDEFALREMGMSSTPAQQFFMVHPDHIKTLGTEIELV